MKKLILLFMVLSCLSVEGIQASSVTSSNNENLVRITTIEKHNSFIKRRRKKGFLWGIFRKKDCGCPKH